MTPLNGPLRVGIGGPVGAGKTSLTAALARRLHPQYSLGVITNDIYTQEDAEALMRMQILGEEIPRKGGPAISKSDLLVINKTDLAPHVGASLDVMRRDCLKMRGEQPYIFCSLRHDPEIDAIVNFVVEMGGLGPATSYLSHPGNFQVSEIKTDCFRISPISIQRCIARYPLNHDNMKGQEMGKGQGNGGGWPSQTGSPSGGGRSNGGKGK